jgi:hypothetical protein
MKSKTIALKAFFLLFAILLMPYSQLKAQSQIGSDILGEFAGDEEGSSVSISGDGTILATGSRLKDNNGDGSGSVRVFELNNGNWTQLGDDIDGEAAGDNFGFSVRLSKDGSTLAAGAWFNDGNGVDAGHVRVYQLNAGTWTQLGNDIEGEDAGDLSSNTMSISADGSIIAIGSNRNSNFRGHVRVYEFINGGWVQLGSDIDGEVVDEQSGFSVSLSDDGSIMAVGAISADNNNSITTGGARVYEFTNGEWSQIGGTIYGENLFDNAGWAVSLNADGSIVAIGARSNSDSANGAGHVRVHEFINGAWTQLGADIDGESQFDDSGSAVSLSDDGLTVAVGAPFSSENGPATGQTRVFRFNNDSWSQLGSDIDGEAAGDLTGYTLSLSANGNTVAVGSPLSDDNGVDSGKVRVYDLSSLSVIDNTIDNNFVLYPNPSLNGNFSIKSTNLSGEVNIEISNLLGQKVLDKVLSFESNGKVSIDGSELSPGMYIVNLTQEEKRFTSKLIMK